MLRLSLGFREPLNALAVVGVGDDSFHRCISSACGSRRQAFDPVCVRKVEGLCYRHDLPDGLSLTTAQPVHEKLTIQENAGDVSSSPFVTADSLLSTCDRTVD